MATKQKKQITNPANELKTCLMPIGFIMMRMKNGNNLKHACSGCVHLIRNKKIETLATCEELDKRTYIIGHWSACGLWAKKKLTSRKNVV